MGKVICLSRIERGACIEMGSNVMKEWYYLILRRMFYIEMGINRPIHGEMHQGKDPRCCNQPPSGMGKEDKEYNERTKADRDTIETG